MIDKWHLLMVSVQVHIVTVGLKCISQLYFFLLHKLMLMRPRTTSAAASEQRKASSFKLNVRPSPCRSVRTRLEMCRSL